MEAVNEVPSKSERKRNQVRPMPNLTRMVCKECHESYLELRAFRAHFRAKHPDNLDEYISVCGRIKQFITCPLCQATFRAKMDFNSHMTNLHSISRHVFESFDCYDECLLGDVIAEHLRKRSEKMPKPESAQVSESIACEVCLKSFDTARGVVNHKTRSGCGDILLSSVSPAASRSARAVNKTQETTPKITTTRLSVAPQPANFSHQKSKPQAASATASTSADNKSFVCEWCRDRLKTMTQLNTHLRSKHSVPENFTPEDCDLPDFFTALEHHFTVVEKEENSYECVYCKETFLEKVGLLEHFSGENLIHSEKLCHLLISLLLHS